MGQAGMACAWMEMKVTRWGAQRDKGHTRCIQEVRSDSVRPKVRSRVMLKTLEPVDEADTHFRLGADYLVVMMIAMMICKRWLVGRARLLRSRT